MLQYLKTSGIILRRDHASDYGERLSAFTRKNGKINFTAEGMRRTHSKLSAVCLPGNIVYMTFAKRQQWKLTGAKVGVSISLVPHDLSFFRLFSAVREIVDTLLPQDESDPVLYEMLDMYVRSIANEKNAYTMKTFESVRFLTMLLKHLGHFPDRTICQHRGGSIDIRTILYWKMNKGFVCNKCAIAIEPHTLFRLSSLVLSATDENREISVHDVHHWGQVIADIYARVSDRELMSLR